MELEAVATACCARIDFFCSLLELRERRVGFYAMSKRDILIFLFKWKGTILSVFFGVVTLVTLLVYFLPSSYTALSTVLVEHTKAPSMRSEMYPGAEMIEVINTEVAIVLSRTVMEHVADRLKLDQLPTKDTTVLRVVRRVQDALIEIGLLDPVSKREQWIGSLLRDVKVKPTVSSNIFTVKYATEDPQLAADIVNAITDEYLSHHMKIYSQQGIAEFYRGQMDEAKRELDRLRVVLEDYKTFASLAATTAKKDRLVTEIGTMRERVALLNLELTDTLSKYDRQHPKAVLIQTKISATEDRIAVVRKQLQDLDRAETQALTMEATIKSQEESYRSYREQYNHAAQNAIDNRNVVNARVVDYADVPARPPFSRMFLIFIAVVGGLVISLVIAMIREYFDHRVSTPEVAERVLGVPVYGSIQYRGRWRR